MSSQRGNVNRSRQQKHKNVTEYKNDMHNKTKKMVTINSLELPGLCQRCREKIQWKIKYRKYKPLTVPKKCIKCDGKCVKHAYYNICFPCGQACKVCCKCGEAKDIIQQLGLSAAEQAAEDSRLTEELKCLTERQRRSFFRLQEKGQLTGNTENTRGPQRSTSDLLDTESEDESDEEAEENSDHLQENNDTDIATNISQPVYPQSQLCNEFDSHFKVTT